MSTDTPNRVTVADFEAFIHRPENADKLFELIHGEIVEKMPTEEHGIIVINIATALKLYSRIQGGRVGTEIGHRLPTDAFNDRRPDLTYRADTRQPVVKSGSMNSFPDLAVEVKSPTNGIQELRDKAAFYLAHGVRMVWLVFPHKQLVERYQPDADVDLLVVGDTLDGGDVLPGFSLPVADVFDI